MRLCRDRHQLEQNPRRYTKIIELKLGGVGEARVFKIHEEIARKSNRMAAKIGEVHLKYRRLQYLRDAIEALNGCETPSPDGDRLVWGVDDGLDVGEEWYNEDVGAVNMLMIVAALPLLTRVAATCLIIPRSVQLFFRVLERSSEHHMRSLPLAEH